MFEGQVWKATEPAVAPTAAVGAAGGGATAFLRPLAVQQLNSRPSLQHYVPNKGAAIVAVLLYALISIAVTAVTVKTRTWYMLLVSFTALLELAGWGSRLTTLSSPTPSTWGWQQTLLIISPLLLAIVQYITLHKLLLLPGKSSTSTTGTTTAEPLNCSWSKERPSSGCGSADGDAAHTAAAGNTEDASLDDGSHPIIAKLVLWLFSAIEVVCFLLQTTGAAVYVDPTDALYGRLLLLAGLGIQLVFFSAFFAFLVVTHTHAYFGFRGDKAFRPVFVCLYTTTMLLRLRDLFRIAEFAQGYGGNVATSEAYLYVLDFLPIVICFLLFTCMHYGWWLGPAAPAHIARLVAAGEDASGERVVALVPQQSKQESVDEDVLHVHCA